MTFRPIFALTLLATSATAYGDISPSGQYVFDGTYPTESVSVVLADFNADGNLDVAATSGTIGVDNEISVAMGNGANGYFDSNVVYSTGADTHPWGIVAGDWDADGDVDLATANQGTGAVDGGSVTFFFNDGTGAFDTSANVTGITVGKARPVVTDIDSDGDLDILTAGAATGSLLTNDGSGGFTVSAGPGAVLAAGDLNGDTYVDVIVRNAFGVRLSNGDGTFAAPTAYTPGSSSVADAELGDLDGDGDLDLVVVGDTSHVASAFLNNGSGTFSTPKNVCIESGPVDLALGDLNFDGALDIAIAASTNPAFTLLFNDGNGFSTNSCYTWPQDMAVTSIAVGDVNNDTFTDVVIATGGAVMLHLNEVDTTPSSFTFTAQSGLEPGVVVESNTISVLGIEVPVSISIVGGEYRVNGGAFTSEPGVVHLNDSVQVRLTASSSYDTQVSAALTIGGAIGTFRVTTRENIPPTVASVYPANLATGVKVNSVVSVRFSEPVDCTTITTASFKLKLSTGTAVAGTVRCYGNTATFIPKSNLGARKKYIATVGTTVKDLAGNALTAIKKWSFTAHTSGAKDTVKPTVVSVTPADKSWGAPDKGAVTATFSENLDCSTVTSATFTLSSGYTISGTVSCSGKVATFTPTGWLPLTVIASLTTDIKDLGRNSLVAPVTWTFHTF